MSTNDFDDLQLFREFVQQRSRRQRNQLVERHMGLAAHIAKRYGRSGTHDDDLRQVAMLGLVKAVDRFDPEHGAAFSSFAGLTIEGELKRHFRDTSWSVKVPRSAKELHLLVRNAADELSQRTAASPTVDEIAAHLGVDREDVVRGMAATAAYSVGTLDAGAGDDDAGPTDRQAVLAEVDPLFEHTENVTVLAGVLDRLPERERRIVELRFFDQLTQSEIAEQMGMSQMHVSRLLRQSFEQLRGWLDGGSPASGAAN